MNPAPEIHKEKEVNDPRNEPIPGCTGSRRKTSNTPVPDAAMLVPTIDPGTWLPGSNRGVMMAPIYADATAAGGDSNGSTALAGERDRLLATISMPIRTIDENSPVHDAMPMLIENRDEILLVVNECGEEPGIVSDEDVAPENEGPKSSWMGKELSR